MGAFFISVCWVFSAQAFCPAPGPLPQFRVARVVDGDTLRLSDGRKVRLIGLNAPELAYGARPAEPFAEVARHHLEALVRANKGRVGLQSGPEPKDRHGRLLAHLYDAQGRNLEAALLAEGLGYFVALMPNTLLADCHQAAERHARKAGKGLWRKPSLLAAEDLQQSGFAHLRGQVERVERNRAGVWLELGGSLVLQVPAQALGDFEDLDLASLGGRTLEVRGWVIERKVTAGSARSRWLLRISHPGMLDVQP